MDSLLDKTLPAPKLSQLLRVARIIGPLLITILIGWGTVQFSQGRNSQRLDAVEDGIKHTLSREEFKTWTEEQREMLRSMNQKTDQQVTRKEFELFSEQNRDQFRELKEDLRSIKTR